MQRHVKTIGIAYDLKEDIEHAARARDPSAVLPEDAFEEYDSDATLGALEQALRENGYETLRLGGGRALLRRALEHAGDLVFNIAEGYGTRSREAHVPSALEMLGIPYTHSDPLTLGLTLDKAMAKRVLAATGIATPRFVVVENEAQLEHLGLSFPMIAKPLFEGSSVGVRKHSRVVDPGALRALAVQLLRDYRQPVLVEEFCSGPEFTVGILGTDAEAEVIGTMEIVPRTCAVEEFTYSLEVKRDWRNEVEYQAPPRRPAELVRAIESLALSAYRTLTCRDVGRVDVRLDAEGMPRFLEINPLPGLNPDSSDLPILARAYGISYPQLIGRIVESARKRLGTDGSRP